MKRLRNGLFCVEWDVIACVSTRVVGVSADGLHASAPCRTAGPRARHHDPAQVRCVTRRRLHGSFQQQLLISFTTSPKTAVGTRSLKLPHTQTRNDSICMIHTFLWCLVMAGGGG